MIEHDSFRKWGLGIGFDEKTLDSRVLHTVRDYGGAGAHGGGAQDGETGHAAPESDAGLQDDLLMVLAAQDFDRVAGTRFGEGGGDTGIGRAGSAGDEHARGEDDGRRNPERAREPSGGCGREQSEEE